MRLEQIGGDLQRSDSLLATNRREVIEKSFERSPAAR